MDREAVIDRIRGALWGEPCCVSEACALLHMLSRWDTRDPPDRARVLHLHV